MEDAGVTWSAAEDRSTWAISLGDCTDAGSGTLEDVHKEDPMVNSLVMLIPSLP